MNVRRWAGPVIQLSVLLACCAQVSAQRAQSQGPWTQLSSHTDDVINMPSWIRPLRYQALECDMQAMRNLLAQAPLEFSGNPPLLLALPDPDGNVQIFEVFESPIMEAPLAAAYPDIHTFVGQGVSDPGSTLRADVTLHGFHAQVRSTSGSWYIDPFSRGNTQYYSSYYKRNLYARPDWSCEVEDQAAGGNPSDDDSTPPTGPQTLQNGTTLRTYRLACAATVEYTAYHGGTVPAGLAAVVTAINRVTGVYEVDVAVRLILVANNNLLIYTGTDPYSNGSGSTMLGQNQTNIDSIIGTANYDIGHVFSTGGGGVAGLGVTCVNGSKARGVTGQAAPIGDPFYIDYVAHEMGHQFGANHTFNSTTSSCGGGNRSASNAYEIGSGSTIMAYAGICGTDNLQPNSDAYFHSRSLDEIITRFGVTSCYVSTATGNSIPTISVPAARTIPIGTPIALTATASDANGDALTYCWEERDLGAAQTLTAADNGTSPLVRSKNPLTSPTRVLPQMSTVLAGTIDNQEKRPAVSRSAYTWRCTVRDNRINGGAVNDATVALVVTSAAGPFTVTSQAGATTWPIGSTQTVTWNVAGTTANGVNCANVDILLSTDGGQTFATTLASGVANNGSANITVPAVTTTAGRIMVRAVNNYFFNVNTGVITTSSAITGTGANTILDNTGNGNSNTRIDPSETSILVTVPVRNFGATNATGVSAIMTSLTPTVTVATSAAGYPNLAAGVTGSNTTPYVISVAPSHVCGAAISLRLTISSSIGAGLYEFSLPTGLSTIAGPTTIAYSGPVVNIPDANPSGASATMTLSGFTGVINDLDFRINGTTCNTTAGSTTVGLDHSWVSDLVVTLRSPAGTVITLMNRPGGENNGGNNFCNTLLDDEAVNSIQSITAAGNPYSASFTPNSPLSAFDGQNPNGIWTLFASDAIAQDTGNIRAFSLIVRTVSTTCDAPLSNQAPTCSTSSTVNPAAEGASVNLTGTINDAPADTHSATVDWGDGSNPESLTVNQVANTFSGNHFYADNATYPVVVTVTDNTSLSNTCAFNQTINNVAPTLATYSDVSVCPGATVNRPARTFSDPGYDNPLNGSTETFTASVNWGDGSPVENPTPTWTSGSGGVPTSGTVPGGSHVYASPGNYTVVVQVADDDSGSHARSFIVTVGDTTPPTINACAGNQSVNANAACQAVVPDFTSGVSASDNCSAVTVTQSPLAGSTVSGVGPHGVILTATDASNNSETCNATLTLVDVTPPSITTCANNQSAVANSSCQAAVPNFTIGVVVSDNCGGVTLSQSPTAGTLVGLGVTNVTITATDGAGLTATCGATFTVTDTTTPSAGATCPANISVNTDPGSANATGVSWPPPSFTDNCSSAANITITPTHTPPATFPIGVTSVTYTARDEATNETVCSFTITVVDAEAPSFNGTCPTTITANADAGACGSVVSWVEPTATDNSGQPRTVIQTQGPAAGSTFNVGTTQIQYSASDAAGNTALCNFDVIVVDNQDPVIADCPANIMLTTDAPSCGATASWTAPTVSDNCPGATIAQTSGPASGTVFPVGITTVIYIANDTNGRSATCSFNVTVTDDDAPVITDCADDQSAVADANCNALVPSFVGGVSANDNCTVAGSLLITQTPSIGTQIGLGATPVTIRVEDQAGNFATCVASFTVTAAPIDINQHPEPVSVCTPGLAQFDVTATGNAPLSYQWRRDTVDLSDGGSISGAQTATLVIDPALPANAGSYDCVVTNNCISATSNAAALTVQTCACVPCSSASPTCCKGDMDASGGMSGTDIREFAEAYVSGTATGDVKCRADMNGDDALNTDDVPCFIGGLLSACSCP